MKEQCTYSGLVLVTACLYYSLRPILTFANTNLSSTKICLDTSVFAKGNIGRREYMLLQLCTVKHAIARFDGLFSSSFALLYFL
jgi:hypothetical protein